MRSRHSTTFGTAKKPRAVAAARWRGCASRHAAVGHHVLAHRQRLHARRCAIGATPSVSTSSSCSIQVEDLRQLAGERRLLVLGHPDARQGGDPRHGGLVQRHAVDVSCVQNRDTDRYHRSMPLCNPAELQPRVPAGARLLGLDVGTKTIGLALSDTTLDHRHAARHDPPHAASATIIERPARRDRPARRRRPRRSACRWRSTAATARAPRACASSPATCWRMRDLPVAFWDERLSTAAVEREMIAADLTRKRRAEIVDKVAAAYILQGLLDHLSHSRRSISD